MGLTNSCDAFIRVNLDDQYGLTAIPYGLHLGQTYHYPFDIGNAHVSPLERVIVITCTNAGGTFEVIRCACETEQGQWSLTGSGAISERW
ncbi:hypothetical protein SAMN05444161_7506 [Rhizobiales bacterium GAS191]|nr:hypothetical protein SAMN05444161_7506 [Rhizobiales bacterium GAS191]